MWNLQNHNVSDLNRISKGLNKIEELSSISFVNSLRKQKWSYRFSRGFSIKPTNQQPQPVVDKISHGFSFILAENFAYVESLVGEGCHAVTTSHLSPSRRSHNIHVRYVHAYSCERASRGSTRIGEGKRRREFVIVIARRGRAAIVITARHRSYRRVGLLRPVRIFRRIHSRSLHFARPTRIFAPLHELPAKDRISIAS